MPTLSFTMDLIEDFMTLMTSTGMMLSWRVGDKLVMRCVWDVLQWGLWISHCHIKPSSIFSPIPPQAISCEQWPFQYPTKEHGFSCRLVLLVWFFGLYEWVRSILSHNLLPKQFLCSSVPGHETSLVWSPYQVGMWVVMSTIEIGAHTQNKRLMNWRWGTSNPHL